MACARAEARENFGEHFVWCSVNDFFPGAVGLGCEEDRREWHDFGDFGGLNVFDRCACGFEARNRAVKGGFGRVPNIIRGDGVKDGEAQTLC